MNVKWNIGGDEDSSILMQGSIQLDATVEVGVTSIVPGFIVTANFPYHSSDCA
jgi:hypothetical protein